MNSYITTSLFDLFKVGPGPSSSHTIGPMKAGHHFSSECAGLPRDLLGPGRARPGEAFRFAQRHGDGHGTDAAVLAGVLGTSPENCPSGLL